MKNNQSDKRPLNKQQFNKKLCQFLDNSPTPYHASKELLDKFLSAGFTQLKEEDDWSDLSFGSYVISRNDSSIIAINLPKHKSIHKLLAEKGIRMSGAHSDSPCLKLKPNPQVNKNSYLQLGVEVYGGVLLNPWFDRDLSLAGRISYEAASGEVKSLLVDFKKAIAIIPSLAIHLDRNANNEKTINSQTDILPIILQSLDAASADQKTLDFEAILMQQIKKQYPELKINQLLASELSLYDTQKSAITGLNDDFISSARLDNLLSCFIEAQALIDSDKKQATLLICNDHEEVGSQTASGAQGNFLISVLQRLCQTTEAFSRCISQSLFISTDNAHGVHPNFSDKHDGKHLPLLNYGPVIKVNANQRYASNSETIARFKQYANALDIKLQSFVARADMGCGSTIGPLIASNLGIRTIDVGIATFAMHSIREMSGSSDPLMLYQLLLYYNNQIKV